MKLDLKLLKMSEVDRKRLKDLIHSIKYKRM